MENKIGRLENYTIKSKDSNEEPVKRCRFYYLHEDHLWKEFDVEGHYDLESAFELTKNIMVEDVIQMALKESLKSLDLPSKNYHFKKDGEINDLRDFTFDKDILEKDSELFKLFKQLLLDNWNDDFVWYYFRADAARNANIHDDSDKKRVYDHYFESLKEFNNRISFLEYYSNYSLDWEIVSGTRKIFYPLIRFGDYHCIDNTITREELKKYLFINRMFLKNDDYFAINTVTWGAFAYYFGMHNGLTDMESKSFANVLSGFIAVLQFDHFLYNGFETDKHFKEKEIENALEMIVYRKIEGNIFDHTKEIFFSLFDIYKNHIQNFEFKTKRLEFRVSESQYNQFMALEGESKSDKLNNLLKYSYEKIDNSILPDIKINNECIEKWSEEKELCVNIDILHNLRNEWLIAYKESLEEKYGEDYDIVEINNEFGYMTKEELSIMPSPEELEWEEKKKWEEMLKDIKEMEELDKKMEEMQKIINELKDK